MLTPLKKIKAKIPYGVRHIEYYMRFYVDKDFDFDVYLASKKKNLQRGFIWTDQQKSELIRSCILGIDIPSVAINNVDKDGKTILEVIDGKQRLSTIIDFFKNKIKVQFEGKWFYHDELPNDYQKAMNRFSIKVNEYINDFRPLTDQEKEDWFETINFKGTPQEKKVWN